jgi:serine protease AprX
MEDPEKHQMSTGAMHIGEPHGEMPGREMELGPSGGEMPSLTMESMPIKGEMPGGEMGSGQPAGGLQRVLVEIRVPRAQGAAYALQMAAGMNVPGFQLDIGYESVPVSPTPDQAAQLAAAGEEVVIVRGTIEKSKIPELEAQPNIVKVYLDTPIATFTEGMLVEEKPVFVTPSPALAPSPIPPCDCDPGPAKGAIADVA